MLPLLVVKERIMKIFKSCDPRKDHYIKIYELDDYFYDRYTERIELDDDDREYILFKINIYSNDYSLLVDIGENYENKDLIFKLKKEFVLKKELDCEFIKINALEDLDYEISCIQNFINVFKDNKIKELEHKIEKLELDKLKLF